MCLANHHQLQKRLSRRQLVRLLLRHVAPLAAAALSHDFELAASGAALAAHMMLLHYIHTLLLRGREGGRWWL